MTAGILYWALFCLCIGAMIYALLLDEAGDDETPDSIALGGASLAQELRRHAAGPRPDHCESLFHARSIRTEEQ